MRTLRIRNFLTIALLTACAAILAPKAVAALQIYKVKGDVYVKSKSSTSKATRRANVAPGDLLNIPDGGCIEILDTDTRRIYSSTKTGKMTVKSLMKRAESQASNITRNINRKVMAAVADNTGQKRSGYDAIGMAIHETDAVVPTLINIPDSLSYLSYLLSDPSEADSAHQSFISLSRQSITDEEGNNEGAFNFVMHNNVNKPLYFNIVEKDKEKGIRFLFKRNPIVGPKSETTVEEYSYIPDGDAQRYVAVASDTNFSLRDVKHLLDADHFPKNLYYFTILTINQ